jgi:hypothetical protein
VLLGPRLCNSGQEVYVGYVDENTLGCTFSRAVSFSIREVALTWGGAVAVIERLDDSIFLFSTNLRSDYME